MRQVSCELSYIRILYFTLLSVAGPLSLRDETEFVCRAPRIVHVTPSLAANETSSVMLSCAAAADPAPEVVWRSPTDDRIVVGPPADRRLARTAAFWELRNVRTAHAGWYACRAANSAGSRTAHTYLHVVAGDERPPDLAALEYPAVPHPLATSSVTSSSPPPTSFRPDATTPSAAVANCTQPQLRSATGSDEFVTSTHAQSSGETGSSDAGVVGGGGSVTHLTTTSLLPPSVDDVWRRVVLVAGCVLAGLVLVAAAVAFVVCCARLVRKRLRRRRRAKAVPPAPRTIRDDFIRRPKPFPGISMAANGDDQAAVLHTSPPLPAALPASPSYGRPERLDLLSAEYDRSCDSLHTFERRTSGTNGCS